MSLEGRSTEEVSALAELANTLASNPKTRAGFLQLTKAIKPDAAIPEIDIPASLEARFKPHLDELASVKAKLEQRELRDRLDEGRRAALKVGGITDNDMPAIEKLMVDKQIPTHETAAEFYAAQRRTAEPTPGLPNRPTQAFRLPSIPEIKDMGNLREYRRQQAYKAIDELRGRRA